MKTDRVPEPGVAARLQSPAPSATTTPTPGRRPRLALLIRRWDVRGGGAERYAIELARRLTEAYEVHVYTQQTGAGVAGVHVHPVGWALARPRWLNQLWFALWSWWHTRHGYDLVHSHELTWHGQVQTVHVVPVRATLWAGRKGWRAALQTVRVLTSPRLLCYLALEAARLRPRPGRVVVLSAASLQPVVARAYPRTAAAGLAVLPPGVDAVTLPTAAQRQALRAGMGCQTTDWVLLFVANDVRRKGLDAVLQAMTQLPAHVVLRVVGQGRDHAAYAQQAQAMGLSARVRTVGALDPVTPAYLAADALVHPTREDTYGMVVLEAQAAGLPVVISPAPWCGIAADLRDGVNALILPHPDDACALAAALGRLQADTGLRARLVAGGLAHAAACGWTARARVQHGLYQQVLNGL